MVRNRGGRASTPGKGSVVEVEVEGEEEVVVEEMTAGKKATRGLHVGGSVVRVGG